MKNNEIHKAYLAKALTLAKKAFGVAVNPNPKVGAVLVKEGKVIGEGYHNKCGGPHAEVMAISNATESPEGATLYCTLAPCSHTQKLTPPCTEYILKHKIKEIHVCSLDPNPLVSQNSPDFFKKHQINFYHGLLCEEENFLNRSYRYFIQKKRPWVSAKWAQSLDGYLTDQFGYSQWISNADSRRKVQELRAEVSAIAVGANTAHIDNPRLNLRLEGNSDSKMALKRIILGDFNPSDLNGNHLLNHALGDTWIISNNNPINKLSGVNYIDANPKDLNSVMQILGENKISHLMVEGGPTLLSNFFQHQIVNECTVFIASKLAGGGKKIQFQQVSSIQGQLNMMDMEVIEKTFLGDDYFLRTLTPWNKY